MERKPARGVFARVLIAEDDASQLRTLSAILRAEGFEVIGCNSAEDALRQFAANDVDVAVVDLRLPDAADSQLLDRMSKVAEAVPLIVNTGHSSYESARKAVNVGAFAYVEKGSDPSELIEHVRRASQVSLRRYADALESAVAERTRQLEEALAAMRQKEEVLLLRNRAIDAATQGISIIDPNRPNGPLVYINQGFTRMTGYGIDEVVGRNMAFLRGAETDVGAIRRIRDAIHEGRRFDVEILTYRKDGTSFWDRLVGSPVSDESGKVTHYIGIHEDITAKRTVEDLLQNHLTFISALIEAIPSPIFFSDTNGRYLGCNRAFADFVGLKRAEVVGRKLRDVWPKAFADEHERMDAALLQQGMGAVRADELTVHRHGCQPAQVVFRKANYVDGQGRLAGIVGVLQDITDLRAAQRGLQQREAELAYITRVVSMGEMAATLAHELNQPLHAIANYAHGMLRRISDLPELSSEFVEVTEQIAAEARRTSKIVDRLRHFLRRCKPRPSSVNVNDVVQDTIDLLRYEALNRRVTVRVELAGELPMIVVDSIQLQQVVVNLMRNAFAALDVVDPECRAVTIGTRQTSGGWIEVSVSDTGPGIPPELGDRIFEAFFTTKSDGLGMGLAICRSIAEMTGGSVDFEPNHPQGAIFRYKLPLSTYYTEGAPDSATSPTPRNPRA